MSEPAENETWHKTFSYLSGPYVCIKAKVKDVFENEETKRNLLQDGVGLSTHNPDNLMYISTKSLTLNPLKKNIYCKETQNQMFLTPFIAVIFTNGQAKKIWSDICDETWRSKESDDNDDECEEEEPDNGGLPYEYDIDFLQDGLEKTISHNECVLLFTTQHDLCARMLMGCMPFHLSAGDTRVEDDELITKIPHAELIYGAEVDNPLAYIKNDENLGLDTYIPPINFKDERKSVSNFYNNICHVAERNDVPYVCDPETLRVQQQKQSGRMQQAVGIRRTGQHGQDEVNKTAKKRNYSPALYINNSQYIVMEILSMMCFIDTTQYAYGLLDLVPKLCVYSSMVIKVSKGGTASNIMPRCTNFTGLEESLEDVYIGLIQQRESSYAFLEKHDDGLIDRTILSTKAVMTLTCGLLTNRTFIAYQKRMHVKTVCYGKEKKEKIIYVPELDKEPDEYKAMKDAMGNFKFVVAYFINYMRAYMKLCKVATPTFLRTKGYASVFMEVSDRLNSKNTKTNKHLTETRSNAIVMLRIYNQTADSAIGSFGKNTESVIKGGTQSQVQKSNFGPAYDSAIEYLSESMTKELLEGYVWHFEANLSNVVNFQKLITKLVPFLDKFGNAIHSLNFPASGDLKDLTEGSGDKMECISTYLMHKSVWEYGTLGQLIMLSLSRLLHQKVPVICDNNHKGRAMEVLKQTATQYTGTSATEIKTTKNENEVNTFHVTDKIFQKCGEDAPLSSTDILPKQFNIQKQSYIKSRQCLVSYEDTIVEQQKMLSAKQQPSTSGAAGNAAVWDADGNLNLNTGDHAKEDHATSAHHLDYVVKYILNFCKKVYNAKCKNNKERAFQLKGQDYSKVTMNIKKMLSLPSYGLIRESMTPFDWNLQSENLDESVRMFVTGCLLHKKGYLSHIKIYSPKPQINPLKINWVQRVLAVKNKDTEDFELQKTHCSITLRKCSVAIEGAHVYWNKFPNPKDPKSHIIRLQLQKPNFEKAYRSLTLGKPYNVNRTFTFNMVAVSGKDFSFVEEKQEFTVLTENLETADSIDTQTQILKDNIKLFRKICSVNEDDTYSYDQVYRSLPHDEFEFYTLNSYICRIIVSLLNGTSVMSIKAEDWYQTVKQSQQNFVSQVDSSVFDDFFQDDNDANVTDDDDDTDAAADDTAIDTNAAYDNWNK